MTLPAELTERLPALMLRDERRLRRRLEELGRTRDPQRRGRLLDRITADVEAAEDRVAARRAVLPRPTYPEALPITARRDDIAAAIREHQVVIVAGETGSGKTTQLPKICLDLGRGVRGMIGHTQPRRIAARAVAERIAEELAVPFGGPVGYQVRFSADVGPETLVKVMTDGILLAEIQQDRTLSSYDTIIIDEAHERSLNVDFLLGYLHRLLPRRPDLKLVITSATIDPGRFSRHFGDAPVIEVSGRTYPVEVRYRPVDDDRDDDKVRDQTEAICDAVEELCAQGPGDILVFLSGEREIRDTADALRRTGRRDTEVLPLFARLSAAEQHRVFTPHPGRRIVLATNVAETSLTVPGVRYVVDPGTARVSRYSSRLKVQRLPIEPVSRASADQRKGRCGRVADGVCIRLYSEEDFLARPEFTDPEILRTNLASVILQMAALELGEVAAFPFVDPPDRRHVRDGVMLLHELGALDPAATDARRRLTPLGRRLARLPVDPRFGRMVLEADRNGCVREVLVIVAALSIQDPRERPLEQQAAADDLHRRFADERSDFIAYLKLWNYLEEQQKGLSSSQFRRMCKTEFLHYLRVREWQDLFGQLRQVVRSLGVSVNSAAAESQQVHVALLAGLLSHVGVKDADKPDYLGARGARFALFPGSTLFRKPPRWVMAAELVETTRLWARVVARIEPEWVEPLAGHLVQRTFSEPRWDARRGAVMASEKVTLYGVPLVTSRPVPYARIDPVLSREMFIRHALVEGDWRTHHAFFHANRTLLAEVATVEDRVRRRDVVVGDDELFDWYDERVGPDVVSARHFDAWWKLARREHPDLLTFTRSMLVRPDAPTVAEADYPAQWVHGDLRLGLTYHFEPGADDDGVTVHVPVGVLNRLDPDEFAWQVPGLREELVTALLRSLPKALRRHFVPAPDHARAVLAHLAPRGEPLLDALARELRRLTGVSLPADAWAPQAIPGHLRMTFRVVGDDDRTLARGKDLRELEQQFAAHVRAAMAASASDIERDNVRAWDFPPLPQLVERSRGGYELRGFPALVDEGGTVAVRVLASPVEQRQAMRAGTRRLLLLSTPSPVKDVLARLANPTKLALARNSWTSAGELFDDCAGCAVDVIVCAAGGPAWNADGFARLQVAVRADLPRVTLDVVDRVARILPPAADVDARLAALGVPALAPAVADMRAQLHGLVHPGFVTETGMTRLADLPRYLAGMQRRLDRLVDDAARDGERMARIRDLQDAYAGLLAELPPGRRDDDDVTRVRWMLEELRVSEFAQVLGTAHPVSEARILRAIDAVER